MKKESDIQNTSAATPRFALNFRRRKHDLYLTEELINAQLDPINFVKS